MVEHKMPLWGSCMASPLAAAGVAQLTTTCALAKRHSVTHRPLTAGCSIASSRLASSFRSRSSCWLRTEMLVLCAADRNHSTEGLPVTHPPASVASDSHVAIVAAPSVWAAQTLPQHLPAALALLSAAIVTAGAVALAPLAR